MELLVPVIVVVVAMIIAMLLTAGKRRKELAAVAARLGFQFYESDPFILPLRHNNMLAFSAGQSRTAYYTMSGTVQGCKVIVTDYTYTVGSGRNSRTYYMTYCIFYTGKSFRNLQVRPENFLDKVAAWVGFDDIDFEYKQFNDAYYVRSDDKKFAYDIIHPKMMEYLLSIRKIHFEMADEAILAHFGKQLRGDEFGPLIRTTQGIYNLLPTYI